MAQARAGGASHSAGGRWPTLGKHVEWGSRPHCRWVRGRRSDSCGVEGPGGWERLPPPGGKDEPRGEVGEQGWRLLVWRKGKPSWYLVRECIACYIA